MAATVVVFGLVAPGMSAGLPVYAFQEFGGSSWIAGLFHAAFGAGALLGSVLAVLAVTRVAPLRLAAFRILAFAVPLWALPLLPPWPVAAASLFVASVFAPLVNGPIVGVLTARAPESLRAKVLTALVTANALAAPLGFVAAGQVLERWGVVPLFVAVAFGITSMALVFAAIVLRHRAPSALPEPST
jgi:predicted MFS family arabinose efflux permease